MSLGYTSRQIIAALHGRSIPRLNQILHNFENKKQSTREHHPDLNSLHFGDTRLDM